MFEARNLVHRVDELNSERDFLDHVIGVSDRMFEVVIGRVWQTILFNQINDLR
jgi:hypothetical protein